MSEVPRVSTAHLEREVRRAQQALRGHEARCNFARDCKGCDDFHERVLWAARRLDAARSQEPDRTIGGGTL